MDVKEENYRKRMNLGQEGNALVQLLVLNAVIFVVLKFIYVFFLMANASTAGFFIHMSTIGSSCRQTRKNLPGVPGH